MSDTTNSSASPRVITNEYGTIAPSDSQYQTSDQLATILDTEWIQNAFMVPAAGFRDPDDQNNRYYSTAEMKFTDTRLGCNIGINPRPQWCQYSDVPVAGRIHRSEPSINDTTGDYGMGRFYSESIDDPAQRVYMTFGVPEFNSLLQFFSAAYEANQVTLARSGRVSKIFYKAGQILGSATLLTAFPVVTVALFTGKLFSFFSTRPKSKFYSLKPTMHLYWCVVDNLVKAMCVNRGIYPKSLAAPAEQQNQPQIVGRAFVIDQDFLDGLSALMPDIFPGNGAEGINMIAVSTRAQRIANNLLIREFEQLDSASPDNYRGYVKRELTGAGGHSTPVQDKDGNTLFGAAVDNFLYLQTAGARAKNLLENMFARLSSVASYITDDASSSGNMEVSSRADMIKTDTQDAKPAGPELSGFLQEFDAQVRNGTLFATFIVDYTGPQSESWANSASESELAQKINGITNNASEARFTLGDGNLIGGLPGALVGAAADAVTGLVSGYVSGITNGLSNILSGISGGGYIDVPKHWQQSSFQATRSNYSMTLISPYGNPISQLMNIDIPMAMLMAGSLPRAVGKAAYTSPFLCQIFDRGRCQIRLGIIDNLAFTRGTTNLGFSDTGNAMAVKVSFSVMDLSSIMHMPISSGVFDGIDMTIDEDNVLQDYLAVLAGMSPESQIYFIPRVRAKLAKTAMNLSRLTSSAYLASIVGNSIVGEGFKLFTRQSAAIDYTGSKL